MGDSMSGPDYTYVRMGEWRAIYVNGELFFEGHSVPDDVWIELLEDEMVDRKVHRTDRINWND